MFDYLEDILDLIKIIAIVILFLFLGVSVPVLPIVHFSAIGEYEQIEILRTTVNELGIDKRTEDILGKVIEINMYLTSLKTYNKIPIIQYYVPDKLANLDLIKIPKQPDITEMLKGLNSVLGEE